MSLLNTLIPSFTRQPSESSSGPNERPALRPRYELTETDGAYALQVHLPGVDKAGLELTADHATLTITGRRAWQQPAGWTTLHRETPDSNYALVLEHDGELDVEKIHAELIDGVLHASLPKTEAVKPRKITVV